MTEEEKKALEDKIAAKEAENKAAQAKKTEEDALLARAKELGIEVSVEKKQDKPGDKKDVKSNTEEKTGSGLTKDDLKGVTEEIVTAIKDSSHKEEEVKEEAVIYG